MHCQPAFPRTFAYLHVKLKDKRDADASEWLDPAADFICGGLRAGEPVLVHCKAGICRSTTMCIAYIIKYRRDIAITVPDALAHVRQVRSCAAPRPEFLRALEAFALRLSEDTHVVPE